MKKLFLLIMFLSIIFSHTLSFANFHKIHNEEKPEKVKKTFKDINIPFISNNGQFEENIAFVANTFYGSFYLTKKGEMIYKLPKIEDKLDISQPINTTILTERLIGANEFNINPEQKKDTKINYFIGDKKHNWVTNINTFQQVSLGEIYKNIELKLRAKSKNIEKIFLIAPGGEPEDIKIKIDGAKIRKISNSGELEIETSLGLIKLTKPVAYQKEDNKRINVSYIIYDNDIYGFKVGKYDKSKTIVIDPLLASTFIGGGGDDKAFAIALDAEGNIFVAGQTLSSDLPITPNAYDKNIATNTTDIFILKISNDLKNLISATYLGGGALDTAKSLTIDSGGNVYVTGYTSSPDFPTIPGCFNTSSNGSSDVFISKFDNKLEKLLSSTFIGGDSIDQGVSISIDSNNNVIVAGKTISTNFPTQGFPYSNSKNGDYDVFISKFDADLTTLISSTFIGGAGADEVSAMVIDESDNIIITGDTSSYDYPTTKNAYNTSHNGSKDIFISKLDKNFSSLISSTLIGGNSDDYSSNIKIDSSGNVFVGGYTKSNDFPVKGGSTYKGQHDIVLIKFDRILENLLGSTLIGGLKDDFLTSIAIDTTDQIFITGYTNSDDFPITKDPFDTSYNGIWDVFLSKIDNNLSTLVSSTYLGGKDSDYAYSILIDSSNNPIISGYTLSQDFPITKNVFGSTLKGGYDIFISKLDSKLEREKKNSYRLSVLKMGNGSGYGVVSSNPSGINCGYDCSEEYEIDTKVVLTASMNSGGVFLGWSGDCSGTDTTCSVIMEKDITVIANFSVNNNQNSNSNLGSPASGSTTSPYQEINACFIATAVYDSPYAPEVNILREFRDKYLIKTELGRFLVKIYYAYSPPIAEYIKKHPLLKQVIKFFLTQVVYLLIYPVLSLLLFCSVIIMSLIKFKKSLKII